MGAENPDRQKQDHRLPNCVCVNIVGMYSESKKKKRKKGRRG